MEHNNDGERVYIGIPLGIGNKDCIIKDILSSILDLEIKPLYLNVFGALRIKNWPPKVKWKKGSLQLRIDSMVDVTCVSMKKISIINFKDRGLLLNERNELVFKCRQNGKFRLSWLGATEVPTQGSSRDTDAGWILLELIISDLVVDNIICRGDLYGGD